jgi:Ni/Fe-hydrogenase b-type cytochrome subunit
VTSEASVETFSGGRAEVTGERVYRHDVVARTTHWVWALAILVLVMSGLQIFNAAPYLDASDKSNPARRVLAFGAVTVDGQPVRVTSVFGHRFTSARVADTAPLSDVRAFPEWATLPGEQDLADGRRWHLLFAWVLFVAWLAYLISEGIRGKLRELVMRPADFKKLVPMQLYYLRRRKEPPSHGTYNPLQKLTYNVVLFVMFPLLIITGLALSPGVDSAIPWLTPILGGRQFARTWHFLLMALLIGYFAMHMFLVITTGMWNNMRSMITGWFVLGEHDGVGP